MSDDKSPPPESHDDLPGPPEWLPPPELMVPYARQLYYDWAMTQIYVHDDDVPIFLPEPQNDEERAAFEEVRDREQADGRTVTLMDVERFNQLLPEWQAACDAKTAIGFEADRRQYLKEQFISGRDELPELDDLPQPNEAQEPEPHGPDRRAMKPSFSEALQLVHRRLVNRFEAAIAGIPTIQVGSTAIARRNTIGGRTGDMAVCWQVCESDEGTRYLFVYQSGGANNFTREDAGYALHLTGRICPSVASYTGQAPRPPD